MIPPSIPGPDDLAPELEKLDAHRGSVVLIAIDQPETCNFAKVTWGWFSAKERKALRAALERCKAKRSAKQEANTPKGVVS